MFWRLTSDLITHANLAYWYEFLDSVDAGETFVLDPYGTVASPDTLINVKLDGDPSEPRINSTMNYRVTFKAREV